MSTLPSPPAAPLDVTAQAFAARLEAAAFALLREGKTPTVANVRERMGGASPNAVAPALKRWRLTFAAQLQARAGSALDTLPPGVLEIVQALWSRALFEAHRVRSEAHSSADALEQLQTAIAELRERLVALAAREVELEAQRRELAIERRRLTELKSRGARRRPHRRRTSPKPAPVKSTARAWVARPQRRARPAKRRR